MTDLGRAQADWDKLFRELGLFLAPIKYLTEAKRRFRLQPARTQLVVLNDLTAQPGVRSFSNLRFTGTSPLTPPSNIDEPMKWYMRITDGAGTATYSVYRATGGGGADLVAEGSALADSGTDLVLAEQNSSGVSFLIDTNVPTASDLTDQIEILAFPDFAQRTEILDRSEAQHARVEDAFLDALTDIEVSITSALNRAIQALREFLVSRWAVFHKSSDVADTPFVTDETENDNGLITSLYRGTLESARRNMLDETVASGGAQTVVENTFTVGTPAFSSQNEFTGNANFSAPTMEEWAIDGEFTLKCIDDTVGQEEFEVTMRRTDTDGILVAKNNLRIKKTFSDPILGIRSAVITRADPVITDPGGNDDFAVGSNWTNIAGETETNTDKGTIYLSIEENPTPGTFRINGYRKSTRLVADQVFTTAYVAAATTTPIIPTGVGGNLSGNAATGSAPTDGNQGDINLQTFRQFNSNGVSDEITFSVTVSSRGQFQRYIADIGQYYLNSATSGSEDIDENYVSAGTFVPYEVEDA